MTRRPVPLPWWDPVGVLVFAGVFAVHAAVALWVGPFGWDDGAITMAYARTFAETGQIALTPVSETVEGFSTLSWFFVQAALYALFRPDFDAAIRIAQLATGACAALAAVVTYRAFPAEGRAAPALVAGATFVASPFLSETMNGMEMSLQALLLLLAVWPPVRASWVGTVAMAVAATTRFEALAYLVPAALVVALEPQRRSEGFRLAAAAVGGFLLAAAFRYGWFHDVLPNTVWAKRSPAYSNPGLTGVASRVKSLFEVAGLLSLGGLSVVLAAHRADAPRRWLADPLVRTHGAVVLLACALSVATGRMWGYAGRIELFAVPSAVLLAARLLAGDRPLRAVEGAALGLAVFAATLPALQGTELAIATQYRLEHGATATLAREVLGESFVAALRGRLPPPGQTGTTPYSHRTIGLLVEDVRVAAGLETATVLIPDIGGLALGVRRLRVQDLALLTSGRLAREGYAALPALFAEEPPDLVSTHDGWTSVSGVCELPAFREGYRPVVWDRAVFYVAKSHLPRLAAAVSLSAVSPEEALERPLWHMDGPGDLACLRGFDEVLVRR